MNPRYRQTFLRHHLTLTLPIVLGAAFALWAGLASPKLYRSNASLWSGSASAGAEQFGALPPAVQEQSMLNELLRTRRFTDTVARNSPLQAYLIAHPSSPRGPLGMLKEGLRGKPSLEDRIAEALSPKRVTSVVGGNNLLELDLSAVDPVLARDTLQVLIREYRQERGLLQRNALGSAKRQVTSASNALEVARANLRSYLGVHPSTTDADLELRTLKDAEHNAVVQLANATSAMTQASDAVVSNGGLQTTLKVYDPPRLPIGPTAGKKRLIELVFAGAFVGLLISILGTVVVTKTRPPLPDEPGPASLNGHAAVSTNGDVPHVEQGERAPAQQPAVRVE
jgi:hypothetical protein